MSFTFNWAGVNVNPVQIKDRSQQIREDAGKWGQAVRGYTVDKANDEYAGILDARAKVTQIQARIAQLQVRNREIMQELAANTPTAVGPIQQNPAQFVSTPENPTPANYPYSNEV